MQKIAVLGLGHMGAPIARRLAAHGFAVAGWSRTPRLVDGVRVEQDAATAVRDADVVVTMLTDGPAVIDVVTAAGLEAGVTLVDMSTIGPDAVRDLARVLPTGVDLVDAPVAGSTGAAEGGTLRIFAGGTTAAVDRVAPVLATLGDVRRCGPSGSGAAMKVVLNTALVTALAALAEVLQVADAVGVARAEALEALRSGPLGIAVERAVAPKAAHFAVRLAVKDLALSIGDRDLPVAVAAGRHLAAADPEADLTTIITEGRP
ncbi:NAD(P)-dependent oxidoreductase [Dactylosporangium sp. NBC_01737]|uniref:NAD(P)-dependent oxidoreductase n=1 Tax=Dactylosporangium sp. NBC_01737 TaxID=2975959 RepID=UPI002E13B01D|nr:NAD(P)-dependent oxidoreductase [Dactylosporangium sp. NBC_01737]